MAAAAAAGTDSGAQRVLHVALAANEGKDVPYIQNKAALLGVSISDFNSLHLLGVEYLNLADTNFNLNTRGSMAEGGCRGCRVLERCRAVEM